jgi:hypothetical protein
VRGVRDRQVEGVERHFDGAAGVRRFFHRSAAFLPMSDSKRACEGWSVPCVATRHNPCLFFVRPRRRRGTCSSSRPATSRTTRAA